MATFRGTNEAFGSPGMPPRWTAGSKDGVGTAASRASRVWFTLWNGIVTECYYPRVDRPQIRDLQFLLTDGETFFHEEKRHLTHETERIANHVLGYRITSTDPDGRYVLKKEVIADTELPCILERVQVEGQKEWLDKLRMYVLCAPHLDVGGWGNNAHVVEAAGRWILVAERNHTWLALAATVPFAKLSCGFVGSSDGWTDLHQDYQMDWELDCALDGNIALTGELALGEEREFTVGIAFGESLQSAITTLLESLAIPFGEQRERFIQQWDAYCGQIERLSDQSKDEGNLLFGSYSLLLAHEDKTYPGALIASMAIPWGEAKGDEDMGGYHLVWTRDMVNSATGLLAAGNQETPLRALVYLASSQRADGGFAQNFWIDGTPYWQGIQLDEVAFPILLAWRMHQEGSSFNFDPYPMVLRAAAFLVRNGPATQQERWEEAGGYSPSTLASNIAALICAAGFARERGDEDTARFLEEYADFLECHVEAWTVTTEGTLHPDVPRHFIRINPVNIGDNQPDENPNHGMLAIANRPPGAQWLFPAPVVIDAGFLELVRYGVRRPNDPLIVDSLRVVDAILKVDTPAGPSWRRYNHDGYGQRDDGGPFIGYGKGRAWPLLTGERGHYAVAAGEDPGPYIEAMEHFASRSGLLPEQIWDDPALPSAHMYLGKPTGSAMPLMWAHAEYLKLLRSTRDGHAFDRVPAVAERYLSDQRACQPLEIWKPNRQVRTVPAGWRLRIQAPEAFILRWSTDGWATAQESRATVTDLGIGYVDIQMQVEENSSLQFTFYWQARERWEGADFVVTVQRPVP